jgi:hypothetical protein
MVTKSTPPRYEIFSCLNSEISKTEELEWKSISLEILCIFKVYFCCIGK